MVSVNRAGCGPRFVPTPPRMRVSSPYGYPCDVTAVIRLRSENRSALRSTVSRRFGSPFVGRLDPVDESVEGKHDPHPSERYCYREEYDPEGDAELVNSEQGELLHPSYHRRSSDPPASVVYKLCCLNQFIMVYNTYLPYLCLAIQARLDQRQVNDTQTRTTLMHPIGEPGHSRKLCG
ncbi:MAG: hypothetical protein ACI9YT_000685 [Halobacteriales archaeon]|jgi:hypothetical protein